MSYYFDCSFVLVVCSSVAFVGGSLAFKLVLYLLLFLVEFAVLQLLATVIS